MWVVFVRKLKKIILQRDVEKHSGYLLYGGNRNKILNDIVQEADSTEKKPCTWAFIKDPVHIARISKKRILIIKLYKLLLYNDLYDFMGGGYGKEARERMIGYVSWRTSLSK